MISFITIVMFWWKNNSDAWDGKGGTFFGSTVFQIWLFGYKYVFGWSMKWHKIGPFWMHTAGPDDQLHETKAKFWVKPCCCLEECSTGRKMSLTWQHLRQIQAFPSPFKEWKVSEQKRIGEYMNTMPASKEIVGAVEAMLRTVPKLFLFEHQ